MPSMGVIHFAHQLKLVSESAPVEFEATFKRLLDRNLHNRPIFAQAKPFDSVGVQRVIIQLVDQVPWDNLDI